MWRLSGLHSPTSLCLRSPNPLHRTCKLLHKRRQTPASKALLLLPCPAPAESSTSEKVLKSSRLEEIRMVVLNSLVSTFPVSRRHPCATQPCYRCPANRRVRGMRSTLPASCPQAARTCLMIAPCSILCAPDPMSRRAADPACPKPRARSAARLHVRLSSMRTPGPLAQAVAAPLATRPNPVQTHNQRNQRLAGAMDLCPLHAGTRGRCWHTAIAPADFLKFQCLNRWGGARIGLPWTGQTYSLGGPTWVESIVA